MAQLANYNDHNVQINIMAAWNSDLFNCTTGVNMQEFLFIGGGVHSLNNTASPLMNRNRSRIYARAVHQIIYQNSCNLIQTFKRLRKYEMYTCELFILTLKIKRNEMIDWIMMAIMQNKS